MKVVNYGDAYFHRITLRLSDRQYDYVLFASQKFRISPSEYIRRLIDKSICSGGTNENKMHNSYD